MVILQVKRQREFKKKRGGVFFSWKKNISFEQNFLPVGTCVNKWRLLNCELDFNKSCLKHYCTYYLSSFKDRIKTRGKPYFFWLKVLSFVLFLFVVLL